jgi:hypothetical protein
MLSPFDGISPNWEPSSDSSMLEVLILLFYWPEIVRRIEMSETLMYCPIP